MYIRFVSEIRKSFTMVAMFLRFLMANIFGIVGSYIICI